MHLLGFGLPRSPELVVSRAFNGRTLAETFKMRSDSCPNVAVYLTLTGGPLLSLACCEDELDVRAQLLDCFGRFALVSLYPPMISPITQYMVSRADGEQSHTRSTRCVRRPECCEVGLSRAFRVLCSKNVSCHARHLCGCEPQSAICAQQTRPFGGPQCSLVFSRNAELCRCVDKNLISSLSLPLDVPSRTCPQACFQQVPTPCSHHQITKMHGHW